MKTVLLMKVFRSDPLRKVWFILDWKEKEKKKREKEKEEEEEEGKEEEEEEKEKDKGGTKGGIRPMHNI